MPHIGKDLKNIDGNLMHYDNGIVATDTLLPDEWELSGLVDTIEGYTEFPYPFVYGIWGVRVFILKTDFNGDYRFVTSGNADMLYNKLNELETRVIDGKEYYIINMYGFYSLNPGEGNAFHIHFYQHDDRGIPQERKVCYLCHNSFEVPYMEVYGDLGSFTLSNKDYIEERDGWYYLKECIDKNARGYYIIYDGDKADDRIAQYGKFAVQFDKLVHEPFPSTYEPLRVQINNGRIIDLDTSEDNVLFPLMSVHIVMFGDAYKDNLYRFRFLYDDGNGLKQLLP